GPGLRCAFAPRGRTAVRYANGCRAAGAGWFAPAVQHGCLPRSRTLPRSAAGPTVNDEAVRDLARRAGIAVEWHDIAGQPRIVAQDVLRHILTALDLPCRTRSELMASRRQLIRNTTVQALPPLVTATAGRPTRLEAGASEPRRARLEFESGGGRDISLLPVRGRLRVPAIAE